MRTPTSNFWLIHRFIRLTRALMRVAKRLFKSLLCFLLFVSVGWSLSASSWTVNADNDDEYISFNDLELWNAYYYWKLHGLSADKETSYTNTLNTISQGTSTGSFNFSGSFSGSFDANVELAISGLTSTELDDVDDILTSRTFYYFGEGSESNPLIL